MTTKKALNFGAPILVCILFVGGGLWHLWANKANAVAESTKYQWSEFCPQDTIDWYRDSSLCVPKFSDVSVSQRHTCALRLDDTILCWGEDHHSEVNGPNKAKGEFKQVEVGNHYTCGLRPEGDLECWGKDRGGRVSLPKTHTDQEFVQLSAGPEHVCAVDRAGRIECWGPDQYGQVSEPAAYRTMKFTQVSSGTNHTCAIAGQKLICFGKGWKKDTPTTGFKQVSAGDDRTCALRASGHVACWVWLPIQGGHTSLGAYSFPTRSYTQTSLGGDRRCAIQKNGLLYCATGSSGWFYNNSMPDDTTGFVEVSSAQNRTCAIRGNQTIACWGAERMDTQQTPSSVCTRRKDQSQTCIIERGTPAANAETDREVMENLTTHAQRILND